MFVSQGAVERVRQKRKAAFSEQYISRLTREAKRLNLTLGEIVELIERSYNREKD